MGYILKLCSWYPSRVDAFAGDFVQRHARCVATHKKTVVLFAVKDPSARCRNIEGSFTQTGNLLEYRYYYPRRSWLDKLWSQYYYMQVLRRFLPVLIKEHGTPDMVHLHVVWRAAYWALYLQRKFNWQFVITEHSTAYQPNARDNITTKGFLRNLVTRTAFKKSQLFMPVSAQLANTLQQLYGLHLPCMVVPNAVDTSLFYPVDKNWNCHPFRLLHISTMGYQKNITGILATLTRLGDTTENFEVTLIGPAGREVQQAVASHPALNRKVTFTGNIPYPEVAAHIRQANGLFLFSRYENLPCVLLEALCCGVPVVSSNVGGINEVVNDSNGELVPSEDEAALLKALLMLVRRQKKYDHSAIAADAMARFNFDKIGRAFLTAYEKVQ